ncbi:MAG: tryptophan halogenase family protein [Parasphingorhabdus sp.]|uniref:tryptophan halogenase family protein n=1 Tax=Parasphingorhabdus sp. TaxID=2709688 RepID=UPI00329922AD
MRPETRQAIKEIIIVGGGTAGWMTAAALAHKLSGTDTTITLIESEEIGTVGVGEATLPHIRFFNQTLGIDEATLMARTSATFKLGIEFCDWGKIGDRYIHPFGDYGESIGPAAFHHYWARMQASGDADSLDDYSYPVRAAEANRFMLPDPDPRSIFSTFSYAFQFDASQYAAFLSKFAQQKGVRRIEGKIVNARSDSLTGNILSVSLENGQDIEGDFFVDCSGFRGLLIEQQLQTGYDDWSHYLPCNRAIAVPCEASDPIGPYTRATARTAGWQWRIPLQHRIGNGHVYCSDYISDDEAAAQLMDNLEGPPLSDPRQLYFKTGKRRQLWNKNCVAIGLSGGFLEPLESTSIHLIQSGITYLIELFPDQKCAPLDVQEYNRVMDLEFDRIRDFLVLHYVANQRDDAPMWRDLREMAWPDSLREKIEAFRGRGIIPQYAHGLFLPASWLAVFAGQNIVPERYDPRVDKMTSEEIAARFSLLREKISNAVENTGSHLDFIQSYGAAVGPDIGTWAS